MMNDARPHLWDQELLVLLRPPRTAVHTGSYCNKRWRLKRSDGPFGYGRMLPKGGSLVQ